MVLLRVLFDSDARNTLATPMLYGRQHRLHQFAAGFTPGSAGLPVWYIFRTSRGVKARR